MTPAHAPGDRVRHVPSRVTGTVVEVTHSLCDTRLYIVTDDTGGFGRASASAVEFEPLPATTPAPPSKWSLVVIESPFAGDLDGNRAYLAACMRDAILRGESPYASHGLLTQPGVLDDLVPAERDLGIRAGFAWGDVADHVVFYVDRGWSMGMVVGLDRAVDAKHEIRIRSLGAPWSRLERGDAPLNLSVAAGLLYGAPIGVNLAHARHVLGDA